LEAAALLEALDVRDRVPYAIAFYAGLRRGEIHRLEWPEVLASDGVGTRITVRRAKSAAGTGRRPPIAAPLRVILDAAWKRQGCPRSGRVLERSVMSGKLAACTRQAWEARSLQPITLHECRHTYASLLMAAGYTLKELMEFMGHADLQMVARYVKLLPQPGEDDVAGRLDSYLLRATSAPGGGATT
jgi:integrase